MIPPSSPPPTQNSHTGASTRIALYAGAEGASAEAGADVPQSLQKFTPWAISFPQLMQYITPLTKGRDPVTTSL